MLSIAEHPYIHPPIKQVGRKGEIPPSSETHRKSQNDPSDKPEQRTCIRRWISTGMCLEEQADNGP